MSQVQSIDLLLLRWINIDLASPYLDPLMRFFTGNTPWFLAAGLLLIWITRNLSRQTASTVFFLIVAIAATDAICHSGIKIVLARGMGRPCLTIPWVRLGIEKCGNWFTFPSNHAANSMCLAVFWGLVQKKRAVWTASVGIALLVAFSRVYVGVHFPSDVITGMLIGGAFGAFFYFLRSKFPRIKPTVKSPALSPS